MINFHYELDFKLDKEEAYRHWISKVIESENKEEGLINYIFCDDAYLQKINKEYLAHDTLTDIISFDYSERNLLQGDVFISIDRVEENAKIYGVGFVNELRRVMSHGILHYCGYKDKEHEDVVVMRNKEEEKIIMFHVEQ